MDTVTLKRSYERKFNRTYIRDVKHLGRIGSWWQHIERDAENDHKLKEMYKEWWSTDANAYTVLELGSLLQRIRRIKAMREYHAARLELQKERYQNDHI